MHERFIAKKSLSMAMHKEHKFCRRRGRWAVWAQVLVLVVLVLLLLVLVPIVLYLCVPNGNTEEPAQTSLRSVSVLILDLRSSIPRASAWPPAARYVDVKQK